MTANDVYDSAYKGDFNMVKVRLDESGNTLLTKPDNNGRLLLHWAAVGGHDELVCHLLEQGCPVDWSEDAGATPLVLAAAAGRTTVVRVLVSKGAKVDHRNNMGHSALQYACSKGWKEVAQFLVDNDANVNVADLTGATPLHRAAAQGRVPLVEILLERQPTLIVDAKDNSGNTALHLACEEERDEVAILLVRAGASLETLNKEKKSPLEMCPVRLARILSNLS